MLASAAADQENIQPIRQGVFLKMAFSGAVCIMVE
jgi:hypothetical protein